MNKSIRIINLKKLNELKRQIDELLKKLNNGNQVDDKRKIIQALLQLNEDIANKNKQINQRLETLRSKII